MESAAKRCYRCYSQFGKKGMVIKMEEETLAPESPQEKVTRRLGFLINFTYYAALIILAIIAVRCLLLWTLPFILAFLVAALLQRPLKWLVKKTHMSKQCMSVVLVVCIILLLAGLVAYAGWQLFIGISGFVSNEENMQMLENGIQSISDSLENFLHNLSSTFSEETINTLMQALSGISGKIMGLLPEVFAGVAKWITGSLPMVLISFLIWIIASIFLSIDYDKVVQFLLRQVPSRRQKLVGAAREMCHNTIFKMLKAYMLLMLLTFAELSVGLLILQIPYAIPLAALIAVVDILPVLGTGTVLIPWAAFSLLSGNLSLCIGLLVMYAIITVIRNILEPRVVSHQIGLNPLVTLFFMFVGLKVTGGVIGMLLFPLGIIIIKQLQDAGHIRLWK